ncbi:hypothetical protein CN059_01935 [Sinorhizobium medicae]|nr:hypothetical protein CN201_10650 [Sinorhizobium medicae]RVI54600.1 hypothetical protein CN192_16680 [Sinorhizobium medicae]RVJ03046.1 hypothetical protein CN183_22495 [Sinorhizobium medicae]RVJ18388.1 hypothetical protein CN184_23705 [Sinorhizobium medicae]RVJ29461.1 hypothetical protein CN179_17540 [Sinorhizobium medicae]
MLALAAMLREPAAISGAWREKPGCTKLRQAHERRNLAQMVHPAPSVYPKSFEFNSLRCFLNNGI